MNSLRTDDILGAKPRVRHMPMNLIRQRQIPTSFMTNLQPANPEWSPQASPVQLSNGTGDGYPFYAMNNLNKSSRLVNYDFLQNPHNQPAPSQIQNSPQTQLMSRASSEQRYKPISRGQKSNRVDSRGAVNQSMEIGNQPEMSRERAGSRHSAVSRGSVDSKKSGEEGRRLFRGLGFNIISNHKYQYLLEKDDKK